MAKLDKPLSEIVVAAQALEDELAHLESIARSVQKIHLNGEKALMRAATELKQTLEMPNRLSERLLAVGTALSHMQARQQAALSPLVAMSAQIEERVARLQEHMETFGALGKAAGEVSALLAQGTDKPAALEHAAKQVQEISERARALFEAARADDFPDVAREADVLKQRLAAMSKQLRRPN